MLFFAALFLLGLVSLSALVLSYLAEASAGAAPQIGWATWLLWVVFGTLIITGAGGIIYTVLQVGTSVERRVALARRAAILEPSPEARERARRFPTIPGDAHLTDSPGVKLRYRLPLLRSPGITLLVVAIFTLVWNGAVAIVSVLMISQYRAGTTDALSVAVAILFVPVGVLAIYYLFRQLMVATAVGPTSIEIGDHPFFPGKTYPVYVVQMGHLTLRSLKLLLVCEEEVTYRQGTDTRTECRRVLEREVFSRASCVARAGRPLEWEGELSVPDRVMHSFRADHNAIQWKLVVQGEPQRWPSFERHFPIVIYPCHAQASGEDATRA